MPRGVKAPKLSEKNTKAEILDAYEEIVQTLEQETSTLSIPLEETKILESAKQESVRKILDDLSNLKLSSSQAISGLTDQLTQEAERLTVLQKASDILQKELQELYQIKARAGMFKQMIDVQKKREEEFEEEMKKKREGWDEEQKEYEEKTKRERTRSEEEYQYQLTQKKQRDTDLWNEEKRKHEKMLIEEKENRIQMEQELAELRKKVTAFPLELDRAVKEATVTTIAEQKKEAAVAQSFAKQESQAAQQIANLKIVSLEATVKSQIQEIIELKRQLENATRQVKDIAVSVIEGSKKENIATQISTPK